MSTNQVSQAARQMNAMAYKDGLVDLMIGAFFALLALQEPLEMHGWPVWLSYLPSLAAMATRAGGLCDGQAQGGHAPDRDGEGFPPAQPGPAEYLPACGGLAVGHPGDLHPFGQRLAFQKPACPSQLADRRFLCRGHLRLLRLPGLFRRCASLLSLRCRSWGS